MVRLISSKEVIGLCITGIAKKGLLGSLGTIRGPGSLRRPRPSLGLALRNYSVHADAGHGDLLDEVGRRRCAWWIVLHLRLELRVAEGSLEVLDRFPHSVVEEYGTPADTPVKLCGNETGLLLHERGIRSPGF